MFEHKNLSKRLNINETERDHSLSKTGIFTRIMGYAKERGKLEKLSIQIDGLDNYNEKNFAILADSHEKYSHTLRILKNKNPDSFNELYLNELQTIKEGKKNLKESDSDTIRQDNFKLYKESILNALSKTIQATKEVL